MPAFASVPVALDSGSTTASLVPSTIDSNGVAKWFQAGDVLDARLSLTASARNPTKNGSVSRVQVKFVYPIMDTVETTKKIGEMLGTMEFVIPKKASQSQRNQLFYAVKSIAALSVVESAVKSIESVY